MTVTEKDAPSVSAPPGGPAPVRTTIRGLSGVRAALGVSEVLVPGLAAAPLVEGPVDGRARSVLRILGLRQLVQAAFTFARPTPAVFVVGAGVDATHAVSMVAFGLVGRRWRRAALASAGVAAVLAVLQAVEWRRVVSAGAA